MSISCFCDLNFCFDESADVVEKRIQFRAEFENEFVC